MARPNVTEDNALGFSPTEHPEPRKRKPAAPPEPAVQAEPPADVWPDHLGKAIALLQELRAMPEARMNRREIIAHRARVKSLGAHCFRIQQGLPSVGVITGDDMAKIAIARRGRRADIAQELARLKKGK